MMGLRFVLMALVLALCPSVASAAAGHARFAEVSRLRVEGGPRVDLAADLYCLEHTHRCTAVLRWTITSSDEPRDAVVYLMSGDVESVKIGGEAVEPILRSQVSFTGSATRVSVVLPPGKEPMTLELRATLVTKRAGLLRALGMPVDVSEKRHPTQRRPSVRIDLDGAKEQPGDPPAVGFANAPTVSFSPPRSRGTGRTWSTKAAQRRGTATPQEEDEDDLVVRAKSRRVVHGPVVGFGARIRDRTARPWLRGGWEFSAAPRMLHTLALESDLRRMTIVPSTEIGTRGAFFGPSLSLGIGAPIRVAPNVRPGARVMGGVNFWFVGLIGGWDVFPTLGRAPIEHVGHVGLQFSI